MSSQLYATAALHRMLRYDAKAEILGSVGDLSGIELRGTQLLVAPYVHSGLLRRADDPATILSLPELYERYDSGKGLLTKTLSVESIYQGKVYLVLLVGSEIGSLSKSDIRAGDWVVALQENTRAVSISAPGAKQSTVLKNLGIDYIGYPCKFLYEADVYMRISDPDVVV